MTPAKDDENAIDREYLLKALDAADFARMNAGTLSNRELAAIVEAAKWAFHALATIDRVRKELLEGQPDGEWYDGVTAACSQIAKTQSVGLCVTTG